MGGFYPRITLRSAQVKVADIKKSDQRGVLSSSHGVLKLSSSHDIWHRSTHRLTLVKGVYSFGYFLLPMRIPNRLIHVFIMPTKGFGEMNTCISRFGIRIGSRKYLNENAPFGSVSL